MVLKVRVRPELEPSIEALQWLGYDKNWDEMRNWLPKWYWIHTANYPEHDLLILRNGYDVEKYWKNCTYPKDLPVHAHRGDWIVKHPNLTFEVLSDQAFRDRYIEITEELQCPALTTTAL